MTSKWPLEALLHIRHRRYDDSLSLQQQRQQLLSFAVQKVSQCQKQLEDFIVWKKQERDRLYTEILGTLQTQKNLKDFFLTLSTLDLKEEEYKLEVQKAEKELFQAKQNFTEAKALIKKNYESMFKIEKQKELFLAKEKLILEHKSEIEMEDFHVKKQDVSTTQE